MTTLVEFVTARCTERELMARAVICQFVTEQWLPSGRAVNIGAGLIATGDAALTRLIAFHDPARVLAECAAKRLVLTAYGHAYTGDHADETSCEHARRACLEDVLEMLALPDRDHPDYRPEWAPDPA